MLAASIEISGNSARATGRAEFKIATGRDVQSKAQNGARQRNDYVLGQHLTDDPSPRSAKNSPNDDLPVTSRCAGEHEIGPIEAPDHQHQHDGAAEDENSRPDSGR